MSLQSSKFFEISWRLHLLNDTDFLRVDVDSFGCYNKSKKLPTGHTQEGLGGVHLQLMHLHYVEYSLQICYVITFVAALDCNIIYIAFYGLTYMLVEDHIHGVLVCHICILQAKGH